MGVAAPEDPSMVTPTDTFPVVEPTWNLDNLLTEAEEQNPDLGSLKARETAAVWGERAAKSEWLPTFSFSAGWSGYTQHFTNLTPVINNALIQTQQSNIAEAQQCDYLNTNLLNPGGTPLVCPSTTLSATDTAVITQQTQDRYPTVGLFHFSQYTRQPFTARVGVSIPIFTQFSRPLRAAQAGAQADDAREAVRARSLQVRTDVSQAFYALQTAFQTIGIQQTNRAAAQEGLRLATEQYRVGSGTFLDVLNQQAASQQAEADYIRAVYDYHRSIVTLETAVGRSLR
jgi:outer membrane protein TolC